MPPCFQQRTLDGPSAHGRGSQPWLSLRTLLSTLLTPASVPSPATPVHAAFAFDHREMLKPCLASKLTPAATGGNVRINILLAMLSGCLWFLASPPFDFSLLAWIAMVPAMFAIDRASTTRSAALLCWFAGTVVYAGGFYWLVELLRRFTELPLLVSVLLFILFSAYQGTVFLLFGWAVRTLRRRTSLPMVLIAPPVFVTFEFLVPFLFPCPLAISQAWHPHVIQIADLTGRLGVTALLFVVNGAIYDLFTRRRREVWRPVLAGALVLLVALLYGGVRMRQIDRQTDAAPKLTVGVVQPNVAYDMKGLLHPEQARQQLAALHDRTSELYKQGAQLVVWSEGSYPFYLTQSSSDGFSPFDLRAMQGGIPVPLVVGVNAGSPQDEGGYNSALLLDARGKVSGRYDKMQLLAFGERIPGIKFFPWLHKLVPKGFGDMIPGHEVRTLPFNDSQGQVWKLGVAICYEDILPQHLQETGALHPHLLVNLTNDTWFGAKTEPWQHLALAIFGSVEQRTSLVRAVNSGVSAFIDPNGRVLRKTYAVDPYLNPTPADLTLDAIPLLEGGYTVFERSRNAFAYLCLCTTIFLLAFSGHTSPVTGAKVWLKTGLFAAAPDVNIRLSLATNENGRTGRNRS
jgi:apolipoprotein N-acyltransferase